MYRMRIWRKNKVLGCFHDSKLVGIVSGKGIPVQVILRKFNDIFYINPQENGQF